MPVKDEVNDAKGSAAPALRGRAGTPDGDVIAADQPDDVPPCALPDAPPDPAGGTAVMGGPASGDGRNAGTAGGLAYTYNPVAAPASPPGAGGGRGVPSVGELNHAAADPRGGGVALVAALAVLE